MSGATVNAKNKGGRAIGDCWSYLTDREGLDLGVFKRQNQGECKWCKNMVKFNQKADRVREHLRKCKEFIDSQMILHSDDRPSWFEAEVKPATDTKKRKTTAETSNSGKGKLVVYKERILTKKEQTKFENMIGLHFILTGSAFQRADEENLLNSYRFLCPSIKVPSRKQIAGPILKRIYDMYSALALTWLIGAIICLASDGWTNIKNLPVVNYMAINPDKSLFVESVSKDVKHTAAWLSDDAARVIDDLTSKNVVVAGKISFPFYFVCFTS